MKKQEGSSNQSRGFFLSLRLIKSAFSSAGSRSRFWVPCVLAAHAPDHRLVRDKYCHCDDYTVLRLRFHDRLFKHKYVVGRERHVRKHRISDIPCITMIIFFLIFIHSLLKGFYKENLFVVGLYIL